MGERRASAHRAVSALTFSFLCGFRCAEHSFFFFHLFSEFVCFSLWVISVFAACLLLMYLIFLSVAFKKICSMFQVLHLFDFACGFGVVSEVAAHFSDNVNVLGDCSEFALVGHCSVFILCFCASSICTPPLNQSCSSLPAPRVLISQSYFTITFISRIKTKSQTNRLDNLKSCDLQLDSC